MIFIVIYVVFVALGLYLGLRFKGLMILVAGGIASSVAHFVFQDTAIANIISYVCAALAFYFFVTQDHTSY